MPPFIRHCVCLLLMLLALSGRQSQAAGLSDHQRLWPAPVHSVGGAWLDALSHNGVQFNREDAAVLRAVHPLQKGRWSVRFHVELITPAGAVMLPGTLTASSASLANTTVQVDLDTAPPSAQLTWRRLLKRISSQADATLASQSKSPGQLREESVERLGDPQLCTRELSALRMSPFPGRAGLVAHARDTTPIHCRAEAIVLMSSDPERHGDAVNWFHEAWNTQVDATDPRLLAALASFVDPPAALRLLGTDAQTQQQARQHAEQVQSGAPLVCADGSVDTACACGDNWAQCCIHHGGASHCLPPPP